jgi:SAM-dependent methyltransferase
VPRVAAKTEFLGRTFTAPRARCAELTALVLRHIPTDRPLRVLDLGCGTGSQVFDLAGALPQARLVGVDLSEANIAVAEREREGLKLEGRVRFVAADYLELEEGPFELIVSDSTLQNIPAKTEELFGKIKNDLATGGLLVATMPYGCATNHLLWAARRVLRAVRGRWTDRLILGIGKRLHHGRYDEHLLRERVPYMYMVPLRYDCVALRHLLSDCVGLEVVAEQRLPQASPAHPRHKALVFRKHAP